MSYNQATLGTCPRSSGDRASASGAESHRFESCRGHHTFTRCARTHVLSRIYLSLCCVFTLLRTAYGHGAALHLGSSVRHLLFSAQHLLSPFMCKKICAARLSTYSTYRFNYGALLAATLYSHQHTNPPYAKEAAFDQQCLAVALALTCPLERQMHCHFDTLP